jgi:hypothetical protein
MTFRLTALFAASIPALLIGMPALAQVPDFGLDTSVWANDGECDDPRFTGPGTSNMALDANLMADATDCRTAFEAGTAQLVQGEAAAQPAPAAPVAPAPDVKGAQIAAPAVPAEPAAPLPPATASAEPAAPHATTPMPGAKGAQPAVPPGPAPTATSVQVNFGDDSSEWANDGECDDRRFVGQGMATALSSANIGHDATDCQALHEAGQIRVWSWSEAQAATQCAAINFGDNAGQYVNDGECDDPRFEGISVARMLNPSEIGHDAADCSQLCSFGTASLRDY